MSAEEKVVEQPGGGEPLRICICSSNLGNQVVDDLGKWIPARGGGADILVVGMQESTYEVTKHVFEELMREIEEEGNDDLLQKENINLNQSDDKTLPAAHDDDDEDEYEAMDVDALETALQEAEAAEKEDPEDVVSIFEQACLLKALHQLDNAIEAVEKGLALDPTGTVKDAPGSAWYTKAMLMRDNGDVIQMVECIQEASKHDPTNQKYLKLIVAADSIKAVEPVADSRNSVWDNSLDQLQLSLEKGRLHIVHNIQKHLTDEYELVKNVRRFQMRVRLYARRGIIGRIHSVRGDAVNTGALGGLAPNKGGQIISLTIDNTSLAFVSAHLAAHEGKAKCQERNRNVHTILRCAQASRTDRMFENEFDHMFWFGDLKY